MDAGGQEVMVRRALLAVLGLCWALSVAAAPGIDEIRNIRSRFAAEGMVQASVEPDADGRLRLVGQYRDRAEVQLAFNLAQQVVGVRWVAPTTPENVRYPGTEGMKAGILDALKARRPVRVDAGSTGQVHALVVGVGRYQMPQINVIPNAANDAKLFYNYLSSRNVPRQNTTLLLEGEATKARVDTALAAMRARVRPEDTAVLYFSTHGNKPNDLGNMAVVLHDSQIDPRRRWLNPATALQDDEIRGFIEAVSPARVMVVLDICYSGAAFAKVPGFLAASSKDLFVEEETYATGLGTKNLQYVAGKRAEQEKLLVAASGPGERSWDSRELKQGYFTYYFVEELQRKHDVQGAFVAAKPQVQSVVRREVGMQQSIMVTQTPQGTFIPEAANMKF
jgi:hypothetical protein